MKKIIPQPDIKEATFGPELPGGIRLINIEGKCEQPRDCTFPNCECHTPKTN